MKNMSGSAIRQSFIDFFIKKGHTFVPSSSLVPGGDQTLLFTNAGMVQFKDVFLGTDHRPYNRAVNSQKCMRVSGKHNDLDDVGRDDAHHTFFEMLGNWSFGDYYKKEAIAWAWELLTEEWGLEKDRLWATCFQDEKNEIPTDDEAAANWALQPGFLPGHVVFFGRKDNFWEMAETGPCGPCSEIHIDLGPEFCDKVDVEGHKCSVNGDCKRFLELWNLVFIQYNRMGPSELHPLPSCHVDTGMGLERIVGVLQGTYSTYKTDLLAPLLDKVQSLTGDSQKDRENSLTPYRVIADHARAATFLISDGVVPGNTGRNYVCRMIIRRAALFGGKIGLNSPFLGKIAEVVIHNYQSAYPDLQKNYNTIVTNITREEEHFHRTLENGLEELDGLVAELKRGGKAIINGEQAFELYATHGLPLEIIRDIARENSLEVDEEGFHIAMEGHRKVSGAGKNFGQQGAEDADVYNDILVELIKEGLICSEGVVYDPYQVGEIEGQVLAIVAGGKTVKEAETGEQIELVLSSTNFYLESGGQVADKGWIVDSSGGWEIEVQDVRKPVAGIIVHQGNVTRGKVKIGDRGNAKVNMQRRWDIMRNHTATHLLHAEIQKVLGPHARQAGSLVAPDRLRFDFTHPEPLSNEELDRIEHGVNQAILSHYHLKIVNKTLSQAMAEGAVALFGEKYAQTVRTITIGEGEPISYELCGGTHVDDTGDIGVFIILSEASAAAGIRRIEAVTGRIAFDLIQKRFGILKTSAGLLNTSIDEIGGRVRNLQEEVLALKRRINELEYRNALASFQRLLLDVPMVNDIPVMGAVIDNSNADTLRLLADEFRNKYHSGVVALGSRYEDRVIIIVAITEDLVRRGLHAGTLAKEIAKEVGGSGGGKPNLAQAGGKDYKALPGAIKRTQEHVIKMLS